MGTHLCNNRIVFSTVVLLILLLISMSIKSEAQISATFTANYIDASQQSVSGNSIFYLVVDVSGSASLSGSYSINSISTYLSGYGIPSYSPPKGMVVSKPYVLNDTVYFIFAPNITSISPSSPDIKCAYLASVDYNNGVWGNLDLFIGYGFTEAFSMYKGYLYVIWYPNISSSTPYLIVISPSHQIIYNNTVPVNNIISICVLSSDIIVIANSTSKLSILQLSSGSISSASLPPEQLFIYNLSSKTLTHVPNYKDIEPTSFQRVNNLTLLIAFSSNSYSYIAEYNVLNDSIYNVKQVPGTVTVISYYKGLVSVSSVYRNSQTQYTYYNYVFKLSDWSTVYFNSGSTTAPSISLSIGEALEGNTTIYLFTVKVDGYLASLFPPTYQLTSSPSLVYVGGIPQPFSIHSNQEYYNGYTIVTLYWSESVPSTYLIYVNGTLLGSTTDNIYYLNYTKNETVYITVEAQNFLGSINESIIIHVLVYKETTTSITSTTTVIQSNTTTTIPTTTSSTTSSTTYSQTNVESTITSTSTSIPAKSAKSSNQLSITSMYPVEIIIVVIITIAIVLLASRKK